MDIVFLFLGEYVRMEFLCCVVDLCLTFKKLTINFQINFGSANTIAYSFTSNAEYIFAYPNKDGIFHFFEYSHLSVCVVVLQCGFFFVFH